MARSANLVEVNKFNAGLITDASPLTSPDNSSLEEDNMVLNIDGSRNRRLGMDYEEAYATITSTLTEAQTDDIVVSSYRWDNAGGVPDKSILVVQIGHELKFFEFDDVSVSAGLIYTYTMDPSLISTQFSFAVVDGVLVLASGSYQIFNFVFEEPSTITVGSVRLLIRDFFGVEDVDGGVDITRGNDVQNRPTLLSSEHAYNLRNQSWGVPRVRANEESIDDPIVYFKEVTVNVYPSNSDTVIEALYPDAEDTDNRTIDRFFAEDLFKNPLGSNRAAMGYFIIDALERGASRLQQDAINIVRFPQIEAYVTDLPSDITPSGATTITEFAGRVFYSGFPGSVIDGDRFSPKMSSYVLFSKVVESPSDINRCYQEGDPTSKNAPDIIDTDGGFIRVNEAYGIKRLVNLGNSLMIVATNGVWRIYGGTDNGFTATSYIVDKVSDKGCIAQNSIAIVENGFMYWGEDGIYHVTTDQYGSWVCNNISFGRIQNLYDSISVDSKRLVVGDYDTYERKVRWLYNNHISNTEPTRELVLDIQLQAYYINTIKKWADNRFPKPVALFKTDPYTIQPSVGNISQREIGYITIQNNSPFIQFTFSTYRNLEFRDWYSVDEIGEDADAFTVTSYLSGGDFIRDKGVPYVVVHMRRTENGYEEVGGELIPLNQSSCLVQARWDWSNSDRGGKWGREFQAYRYRRMYLPLDAADDYDNGFVTVVSRNKLRGNGKVLSLKFRTEPYRDFHLYGWSMIFSVAENV